MHWLHLLVTGVTYYDATMPYVLSKAWLWLLLIMLLVIGVLCAVDAYSIFDPAGGQARQGLKTCSVMAILVTCNVLLTGMACHDAGLS